MADFKKTALPLRRVNSLDYLDEDTVLKSEFGTGKTASLKPIADKSLYVCPRRSLVLENQQFAKAICINSLHSVDVNKFDYLILDELISIQALLSWLQVDFIGVAEQLQRFNYRILALDANATKRDAELLSKLCNRNIKFKHHVTGLREKPVLLTRNINELFELANQADYGLKLILCDTKKRAESLYLTAFDDGQPKYLITSNTSNSNEVLAEAEKVSYGWIFASPSIESGVSLTNIRYTFTAVIKDGYESAVLPIDCGMQALHRVRNPSAIRVVYLGHRVLGEIDSYDIHSKVKARYIAATGVLDEYVECLEAGRSYFKGQRAIGLEIFSHVYESTHLQNIGFELEWSKRLKESGYTVVDGEMEKVTSKLNMKQVITATPLKPYKFMYTDQMMKDIELDFNLKYPMDFSKARLDIFKYFGAETANNSEEVSKYWEYSEKVRYRYCLKTKTNIINNTGALFNDAVTAKIYLLADILKDTIGIDWEYLGQPNKCQHFKVKNKDIYEHPKFNLFKKLLEKELAPDTRWFWIAVKKYGFNCERYGKANSSHIIKNDIYL